VPGGAGVQSLVQIPLVMKYTTEKLLRGQFIGGVVGAGLGLALAITMGVRRRKTATAGPGAPPEKSVRA
jgi:gas vesicle protein